jgi:hypothetical protein
MVSCRVAFPSVANLCARIKHLGYAAARHIRLYGEKFTVVSDPMSSSHWGCSSSDDEIRPAHSFAADCHDSASECGEGRRQLYWLPSVLREP